MTSVEAVRPRRAGAVPRNEDLAAIVRDVWRSFVGDVPEPGPPERASGHGVRATVSITGGWHGQVCVATSPPAAVALAAAFLAVEDPAALDEADVGDALGELANMLGGNVKSLLPGPSVLSLPRVVRGSVVRGTAAAPDALRVCETGLRWKDEHVVVTVLAADLPRARTPTLTKTPTLTPTLTKTQNALDTAHEKGGTP